MNYELRITNYELGRNAGGTPAVPGQNAGLTTSAPRANAELGLGVPGEFKK
jgi:hypothetical protein